MKKKLLFLTTLFCIIFANAQTESFLQYTNEELFNKAEVVFEGYFIKDVEGYNLKGTNRYNDGYRIEAFKVQRVYKGLYTNDDTIYIVRKGGYPGMEKEEEDLRNSNVSVSESAEIPEIFLKHGIRRGFTYRSPAIFFLFPSDYPDNNNSKYASYNKYRFLPGAYLYVSGSMVAGLNDLFFWKREDFYNYLKQFEGFRVPEPETNIIDHNFIDPQYQFLDSITNALLKESYDKDSKKKVPENPKGVEEYNTLTLRLDNQQIVKEGSKKFVTFDILASSNNPNIFFSLTTMYLGYATNIFGPDSIVKKGKVTVSKGALFNNNENYLITALDMYSSNSMLVNIYSNASMLNRVTLSNTPTVLLHFKIELLPNVNFSPSDLYFVFLSYVNSGSAYTLTPQASNSEIYYYNMTYLKYLAPMITTNFSSISKIAGIGELLTIEGSHFGANQGAVCFKAANDGGETYLKGLDNQYIKSWNDNKIEVRVPSYVSSQFHIDSTKYGTAGSGHIKVVTHSGDDTESVDELQIPYAVMNNRVSANSEISRVYLTRKHCDYDFLFILHSDFDPAPPQIVLAIDKALRDWSALTGLTLKLEKDLNGQPVYADSTNSINKYVIEQKNDGRGLMTTYRPLLALQVNGKNYLFYAAGWNKSRIAINMIPEENQTNPFYWNYDTLNAVPNQLSFYQAFLHEVGHLLLLDHVNNESDLMYYGLGRGTPIMHLTSTDIVISAVKKNIEASQAIDWHTSISHIYPIGGALQTSFTVHKACYGQNTGSITTTTTGGTLPYYYHWTGNGVNTTSRDLTNLATGTYFLNLTDNQNCIQNHAVVVPTVGGAPLSVSFSIIPANPSTPELYKATVSGGVSPYSYTWSVGTLKGPIISDTIQQPGDRVVGKCSIDSYYINTNQMPTSYQTSNCKLILTITDANGCTFTGYPGAKSGNPEDSANTAPGEITVYPNPTTGSFTVSNIENATIYLYSSLSGHIKTFEHVFNNETINIGNLSNGIYFLKIIDGNTMKHEKLILSK